MTFRRGASLTTSSTLGFAERADLGPTAGNGFYRSWPDDLATLQELGISDLCLTLDWARLQPKPGALDVDWAERFEQMLDAGAAIGLQMWATLHDASIPRWFDNEGGFDDAETFGRWWPRWVESAADRFGDSVAGWVPFTIIPDGAGGTWRDTWTILEGVHPVVASVDPNAIGSYLGQMDLIGVSLAPPPESADTPDDRALESIATEWGQLIRDAADSADRPVAITRLAANQVDDEVAGRIVAAAVQAIEDSIGDGVGVEVCFLDPAIAGADGHLGLLDTNRAPTSLAESFIPR